MAVPMFHVEHGSSGLSSHSPCPESQRSNRRASMDPGVRRYRREIGAFALGRNRPTARANRLLPSVLESLP
jgi:hypothetical protein